MKTQHLEANEASIAQAAALLRSGQTVAFPTETVYGLGADATDGEAVARIYEAKGRPSFNPLICHVASTSDAARYARFDARAQKLAEAFWPGPLTLVLPSGSEISGITRAGLPSVGLRVPDHPLAQALLSAFGKPVAAPSANPSGRISPTTAAHVKAGLDGRIAAVLDGGPCSVGIESTIVGLTGERAVLLRPGGVSGEEIEETLGDRLADHGSGIVAPGQLASHYAPEAAMRLDADAPLPGEAWLGFGPGPEAEVALSLSERGDLREAAARLFAALHEIDAMTRKAGLTRIAVAPIPAAGVGMAIRDRLARAASPR